MPTDKQKYEEAQRTLDASGSLWVGRGIAYIFIFCMLVKSCA